MRRKAQPRGEILCGMWSKGRKELNVLDTLEKILPRRRPTKRAADWWDSAAFSGIFLASGFSCSRSESHPAHQRLTQTVSPLFEKNTFFT